MTDGQRLQSELRLGLLQARSFRCPFTVLVTLPFTCQCRSSSKYLLSVCYVPSLAGDRVLPGVD